MSWFAAALDSLPDPRERGGEPRHLLAHIPAAGSRAVRGLLRSVCDGSRRRERRGRGGNTLRRSFDAAAGRSPLADRLRLGKPNGREGFRAGDSEILAARALLQCLDLTSQLVTADAISCRNETAQLVVDRGGDYLLRLKTNRPALQGMVADYLPPPTMAGSRCGAPVSATTWLVGPKTACTGPVLLPRPGPASA